ncbi:hypothetical protein BM1_04342 [Bipolaris maydis]|nr:hypothetical protein BM1_04342 [Bipolaris maydis]
MTGARQWAGLEQRETRREWGQQRPGITAKRRKRTRDEVARRAAEGCRGSRRLPRRGWHARAREAWMAAVSDALTATSALLARALCVCVGAGAPSSWPSFDPNTALATTDAGAARHAVQARRHSHGPDEVLRQEKRTLLARWTASRRPGIRAGRGQSERDM